MSEPVIDYCYAQEPLGRVCTLELEHRGDHVAEDLHGDVVVTWPNRGALVEFLLARVAEDREDALNARDCGEPLWQPWERMLAECEAKRAIVELHDEPGHECIDRSGGVAIYPASDSMTIRDVTVPGCATLRLLAQPYAEHPDYRPEWRP